MAWAQKPGEGRPKPNIAAVSGTVLDASSGEALPFASVVVTSARDSSILGGVLSQEDGTFNIEEVEVGRLWLEIRFPGYVSQRIGPKMCSPRNPESLRWKVGAVSMEPDITALEEAVVVEQASVMEMRVDRRVFHVGNDLTNRGGTPPSCWKTSLGQRGHRRQHHPAWIRRCKSSSTAALRTGRRSREAFLESLPASAVDRVELITNPSARFDPDGTAGILNIVLKKNKLEGVSGQLQATYGTGDNHDANASLNYRTTSWSLSSNLGWNDRQSFMAGETDRTQYWSPDSTSNSSVSDRRQPPRQLVRLLKAEYRGERLDLVHGRQRQRGRARRLGLHSHGRILDRRRAGRAVHERPAGGRKPQRLQGRGCVFRV